MTRYVPTACKVLVQNIVEATNVICPQLQFVAEAFSAADIVGPVRGAGKRFHIIAAYFNGDSTRGKGLSSEYRPRVEPGQFVVRQIYITQRRKVGLTGKDFRINKFDFVVTQLKLQEVHESIKQAVLKYNALQVTMVFSMTTW